MATEASRRPLDVTPDAGAARGGVPRVGVTTSRRGANTMWWLNRLAVWRAGGRPVRLVPGREVPLESLDALVVGGGDDIDARLYGKEVEFSVRVDPERDRLETEAIAHALGHDLPVLGICRGSQMINIVYGGSLHADIHEVYEKAPRRRTVLPRKRVRVAPGSRLREFLECDECLVNSLHHQSVERAGAGLSVVAEDEHGIVQGVEDPARAFVLGVQWHPEFLVFQRRQQRLFRHLVMHARRGPGADPPATGA